MNNFGQKTFTLFDEISDKLRDHVWAKRQKEREGHILLNNDQRKDAIAFLDRLHGNTKKQLYATSFYTNKTGVFSPFYIPDSVWYAYIEPFFNPRRLAKILDSKLLYNRLLSKISHPIIIAYRTNGFWTDDNYNPIDIELVLNKIKNSPRVFIKLAEDSAGGKGVKSITPQNSKEDFFNIIDNIKGNIVIQKGIQQHEILKRINPSSVNTLRILTLLKKNGEVKILSAVVRMGRNGCVVDNASSGGIVVGVNTDGRLKEYAYSTKGERFLEHPDTHIKFPTVVIPNFEQIKATLSELVWMLPQFRMLSWDIAIDQSGNPILIEVNMHSGQLDFHQLCNGPVFGNSTSEIIEEIFPQSKSTQ